MGKSMQCNEVARRMTHLLTLPLRRPLMTANDQRRAHWSAVRAAKADTELLVRSAAQRARLPRFGRCHVTVTWYAPDARIRDSDALAPCLKAVLDALVRGGWLPGDDHWFVASTRQAIAVDRANPRITIEIDPIDDRSPEDAA